MKDPGLSGAGKKTALAGGGWELEHWEAGAGAPCKPVCNDRRAKPGMGRVI